ncbi:MAG TPA: exo-alpha-sialidase, partial [Armatimonadetes bacterium]|nr:exo-alpha-sialidase [Armatimonadota bacterium]
MRWQPLRINEHKYVRGNAPVHIYLYHALLMMVFTYCICGGASSGAWKEDNVLYKVPGQYAAFPSLRHDGKWRLWVGFGWNTTRSHYGPLAGGRSGRVLLFSPDGGVRWFNEGERYYEPPPADVGALKLSDGTLVRAGAWHWEAVTPERARELKAKGVVIRKLPNGRLVATYRAYVRRSTDGGKTWQQVDPKLPTVAMLCSSPARGIVLPDDTIIVPVYGRQRKDEPVMRAW